MKLTTEVNEQANEFSSCHRDSEAQTGFLRRVTLTRDALTRRRRLLVCVSYFVPHALHWSIKPFESVPHINPPPTALLTLTQD